MASSIPNEKNDPSASTSAEVSNMFKTEIFEKITYTWKLENMDHMFLEEKPEERLQSAVFSSSDILGCKWYVSLYPKGKGEKYKNFLSLFLRMISGPKDIFVKFTLSILTTDGERLATKCLEATFNPGGLAWGWYEFVRWQYLVQSIENGQFVVHTKIKMPLHKLMKKQKPGRILSFMSKNPQFCDVVLCAGDEEIPAHKSILAMRSTVLAGMLEKIPSKSKPDSIKIYSFSSDIVKLMLRFMYGSEVNIRDVKEAEELLKASETYEVSGLKTICVEYLTSKMDLTNAVHFYYLAGTYDATGLKTYAKQYISDHSHVLTENCEMLKELEGKPNLLTELLMTVMKDKPPT